MTGRTSVTGLLPCQLNARSPLDRPSGDGHQDSMLNQLKKQRRKWTRASKKETARSQALCGWPSAVRRVVNMIQAKTNNSSAGRLWLSVQTPPATLRDAAILRDPTESTHDERPVSMALPPAHTAFVSGLPLGAAA